MKNIQNNMILLEIQICTYNSAKYISQTIQSIKHQLNKDLRLVILDDGSKDNTVNLIYKNLENIDSSLYEILIQKENKGRGASRNYLVARSTAKYIAIMDSDDISYPSRFNQQLKFMIDNPSVDFCGGFSDLFEEIKFDDITKDQIKVIKRMTKPITHNDIIKNLWRNPFIHPTLCFKKDIVLNSNNYNPKLRSSIDYELYFRLYLNGCKFANIPFPLIYYRKSNEKKYTKEAFLLTYRIAKSYKDSIPCINIFTLTAIYIRCWYKGLKANRNKSVLENRDVLC